MGDPPEDMKLPILKNLYVGGEALSETVLKQWGRGGRRIFNGYGPTECSIVLTRALCTPGQPISIGVPLDNMQVMILDDELNDVPPGTYGELTTCGIQVGAGYRNRADATAKAFPIHKKYGRIYRTGDLCCLDPETRQIIFNGRIDSQVKIRGHRVETEAVDAQICSLVENATAAVTIKQHDRLISFLVSPDAPMYGKSFREVEDVFAQEWRRNLLEKLPIHAIPAAFYYIAEIPVKLSGKVDRQGFPDVNTDRGDSADSPEAILIGPKHEDVSLFEATQHQTGTKWIHEIFERSADRYPGNVALRIASTTGAEVTDVTYAELESKANHIAQALHHVVKKKNDVVAVIIQHRDVTLYAAHLGVLKAGAIPVILDVDRTPAEIRRHILLDTAACAVLFDVLCCDMREDFDLLKHKPVLLDVNEIVTDAKCARLEPQPEWLKGSADCGSGIVYTSGTTGWPKGVLSPHSAYRGFHLSTALEFHTNQSDIVAQMSSLAFDVAGLSVNAYCFACVLTTMCADDFLINCMLCCRTRVIPRIHSRCSSFSDTV